ncbi:MAG TPA: FtsX-like permease family protein [Bacteroidales bacterium]|nr:FtsX-like permease family protein [Bacteroidales bacterium]
MIKFLFLGILRDKSRSLLPIIVVSVGVFLTVVLIGWMNGIFGDIVDINANFTTGHVKVMTRSYADNENQLPNDLAILDANSLTDTLMKEYPNMKWVQRIRFGGLIDVPDANGDTRCQGQAIGTALDLFHPESGEAKRLNIQKALQKGRIPAKPGEALVSDEFATRYHVAVGDSFTYFGTTMNGSMAFKTFVVSGTVRFGTSIMDRGAMIVDLSDARLALDMDDAAGEILGFLPENLYDEDLAKNVETTFNAKYSHPDDEFSPEMFRLSELNSMGQYIAIADNMSFIMVFIFVLAMSVVLWNTGLLGGLRRYNEYGLRLALGEEKKHIYRSSLMEAVLIGILGSVLGTVIGLIIVYSLQVHPLDVSSMTGKVTMLMPQTYRAIVSPSLFYIGYVPGLAAMVLGNALAGRAIYKRKTAELFKELEV